MAVQPRIAAAFFAGGVTDSSRPRDAGTSSAPPPAWMTRAATSSHTPVEAAHQAEDSANTTTPARNAVRRPIRSASRPAGTSRAAKMIA